VDKTLDLIGDTWKFPVCVWYDTKAVNRFAERKEGKNFKRHDADKTADVDLPMPAAIRMRLDAEVFPVIVLLNDNEVSREQYREWRDSRYKYLEVDLDNNWTRAVLVVKTTVRA
jgi:hypothetical protein